MSAWALHSASRHSAVASLMDVVRRDTQPQFDLNFALDKPGLMMRQVLYRLAAAEAGVRL